MIVLHSTKVVYVDIDNTLVTWEGDNYFPHEKHIEMVKRFAKRHHTLIAWSAGGSEWAARVVRELGLEEYFSLAIGKPDWYIDDLPPEEILPENDRIYIKP